MAVYSLPIISLLDARKGDKQISRDKSVVKKEKDRGKNRARDLKRNRERAQSVSDT